MSGKLNIDQLKQDKLNQAYSVKNASIKIEDVSLSTREVKGYFASFDTIDSDNDIIRKGAFLKSIAEHGPESSTNRKIANLRNHDWNWQIGAIKELGEDSKGLMFVSKMGTSTKGEDALRDYLDDILREHSIGFNYIQDKIKWIEDSSYKNGGYFDVAEVKLWEGSGVTFGSNSLTPLLDVAKSNGDYEPVLKELQERKEIFAKVISKGLGTDERLMNIEQMYKQIQQLENSLKDLKPFDKNTLKDNKPSDEQNKKELFLKLLNQNNVYRKNI